MDLFKPLLGPLLLALSLAFFGCSGLPTTPEAPAVVEQPVQEAPKVAKVFKRLLWLGDSQSVDPKGLGDWLLTHAPLSLESSVIVARCSERPGQAVKGFHSPCGSKTVSSPKQSLSADPSASEVVSKAKPDLVVLQFAGNLLGYSTAFVKKDMEALLAEVPPSIPCIWVGLTERVGTSTLDETKLDDTMREVASTRCTYVDLLSLGSYPMSPSGKPLKGDGTHLNGSYGEAFTYLLGKYSVAFNEALKSVSLK